MKENYEDWKSQLETVLIELVGFNEILNVDEKFLILLTKLEGLKIQEDIDFPIYRKTVFESISLLREIKYEQTTSEFIKYAFSIKFSRRSCATRQND